MAKDNLIYNTEAERKKGIAKLLEEMPLYTSIELLGYFPSEENVFNGYAYRAICKHENTEQTYHLMHGGGATSQPASTPRSFTSGGKIEGAIINFAAFYTGTCASCRRQNMYFLLQGYDKNSPNANKANGFKERSFFLRKIGQFPTYEIKIEKEVSDYLTEEDRSYYTKALMNISGSYGIGAFAYLRRIVENETKRILRDSMEDSTAEIKATVEEAFKKYEGNPQLGPLIDEVYKFLPSSIKDVGENPFKFLNTQLSVGIHSLTEEQCLANALRIDMVLKFIIRYVNREKKEIKDIRNALKG